MKRALFLKRRMMKFPFIWDISTPELRAHAYIDLFNCFDCEWRSFENPDSVTLSLVGMARAGNADACEALLVWLKNRNKGELSDAFHEVDTRPGPSLDFIITDEMVDDAIEVKRQGGGD